MTKKSKIAKPLLKPKSMFWHHKKRADAISWKGGYEYVTDWNVEKQSFICPTKRKFTLTSGNKTLYFSSWQDAYKRGWRQVWRA